MVTDDPRRRVPDDAGMNTTPTSTPTGRRSKVRSARSAIALLVVVACALFAACDPSVPAPVPPNTPKCDGLTPTIAGTAGNDRIVGTPGRDIIHGLGGNDTIIGLGGSDTICGGVGADRLEGGADADVLLPGEDQGNVIIGGTTPGGDVRDIVSYSNWVQNAVQVNLLTKKGGLNGNDQILEIEAVIGTPSSDHIVGDHNGNSLIGNGGGDTLIGNNGDDLLYNNGRAGVSTRFVPGSGADMVVGSAAGLDTVDYSASPQAVTVNLGGKLGQGEGVGKDTLTDIDGVIGSNNSDTLIGSPGNDRIYAGNGNDQVDGRGGNDYIEGGAGTADNVMFSTATGGVTVDLPNSRSMGQGNDQLIGIEYVLGSNYDDLLVGTSAFNLLDGNQGTDFCAGNGGNDSFARCEATQP